MFKKGYKMSDAHKEKIGQAHLKNPVKFWLGKKRSLQDKEKMSKAKLKNPIKYWLGKKRLNMTGKNNYFFGKTHTQKVKDKISKTAKARIGSKHPRWIQDRTLIKKQEERNNPNDKQWKYAVYERDNFKCRIADENCDGRIEAHHILSWKDYPELRFVINNGITLCHFHHPRKRIDEAKLSPYFQKLVAEIK